MHARASGSTLSIGTFAEKAENIPGPSKLRLFLRGTHQILGLRLERLQSRVAPIFNHHRKTARPPDATHRRRRKDHHDRIADFAESPHELLPGWPCSTDRRCGVCCTAPS